MKLENQLTSLKYSKKLKELGFKQDSLWWWYKDEDIGRWGITSPRIADYLTAKEHISRVSAYTVAELGEMLPDCSYTEKKGKWYAKSLRAGLTIEPIKNNTEANARAKMLIYLKENKLI